MISLLANIFTKKSQQEAKHLYTLILMISALIGVYLLKNFFDELTFSTFLFFIIITGGLIYFCSKILYPAYLDSKTNRVETFKNASSKSKESVFLEGQQYFNEKHAKDPEEIKRRAIFKIAELYFYEGETTAKKMFISIATNDKIVKIACIIIGSVAGAKYLLSLPYSSLFTLFIALFAFGYLVYQNIMFKNKEEMHKAAYNLSLQWRRDYQTRITNERVHRVKGWADNDTTNSIFSSRKGVYIGAGFYWDGQGHILTVGSNRAGKGTNLIIPCLLSDGFAESETSFICIDPKGENAAITSKHIKSQGYNVHILNPFGIPGLPNSRFNPFDYIEKTDDNVIEYCDMLAEMIIPMKANMDSNSEHFDTQARSILSSYMLHLIDTVEKKEKNLSTLFKWVNFAGERLDRLLNEMIDSTCYRGVLSSIIEGFNETRVSGGEKEASGILSTLKKGLEPFKNFKLQDSTSDSDFDFREIAKQKTGIYICIPQSEMEKYAVWLRLVMGCSIKLLQKHYDKKRKVLFIMDEFATLGYMKDFEMNAGYMAGFNVSFWVVLQLLPQIQNLYPKIWETFISNAIIKQFFGIGDHTTAQYVSQLMPNNIITDDRGNVIKQKKLLDPDEVITFPHIILKYSNHDQPFSLSKLPYYEMKEMIERAGDRPML